MPDDDQPFGDPLLIARVRDALAGGNRALARERELAAHIASVIPGIGGLVDQAHAFHRRASRWAVTQEVPAAGVIFAAGLPPTDGPLHADAAAANPDARFVYAASSEKLTEINLHVLAEPGRVDVMTAPVCHPAGFLAAPQSRTLLAAGPVSVQIVLGAHHWPPGFAAGVIAGYGEAEEFPPGSSLCISWGVPDPGPEGEKAMEVLELLGSPAYGHSPENMAGWIEAAGLTLHGQGITDARAFAAPFAERPGPRPPIRVLEAVAVKRASDDEPHVRHCRPAGPLAGPFAPLPERHSLIPQSVKVSEQAPQVPQFACCLNQPVESQS